MGFLDGISWLGENVSGRFRGPAVGMKEAMDPYWPVLLVAAFVALVATPVARVVAFRLGVLDMPDASVKTHKQPTAYLGGLAVLVAFLVACRVGGGLILDATGDYQAVYAVMMVCVGAALATVVGVVDDVMDIKPWQKLIGQGICALFLVMAGIRPDLAVVLRFVGVEASEVVLNVVGYFVVFFFVLGATNSLNLLDGLDGLCGGVTAIITIGFLVLAIHLATWGNYPYHDPIRMVLGLALVGSVFGFMMFNRHPAVIFLGDAGTIFLGYVIAAMMMLFGADHVRWLLASIMIFGLPILDTATALIRRFLNKRPLLLSDRGHIYDQMIDRGIPLSRTVSLNYLLAVMYALFGVFGAFLRTRYGVVFYVVVAIVSLVVVWRKGYFRMAGLRGAAGHPGNGGPAAVADGVEQA